MVTAKGKIQELTDMPDGNQQESDPLCSTKLCLDEEIHALCHWGCFERGFLF